MAGFETAEAIEEEEVAAKRGPAALSSEQREQVSADAVALVCEYLTESAAASFMSSLGVKQSEVAKKQASQPVRSKWDTDSSLDETRKYFGGGTQQDKSKKQKVGPASNLTAAHKRLAQTNTKGMKSMMHFFKKK